MNGISQTVFTVCVVLVATELLCKLVAENHALKFVRGLVVVMLLLSALSSVGGMESESFSRQIQPPENSELTNYLEECYQETVTAETRTYLEKILNTIDIDPLSVEVVTAGSQEEGITVEEVLVTVAYTVDQSRAEAVLKNLLGEFVDLEVITHGN